LDGNPCSACTEDIELEKEINELEIRIEKILIKRRALRTAMNENHDHLIHKFPPEIASHIFIQYAPPSALFDQDDRSTPLYLGAVCRKWRQLAWATPQLWSSLLVGFCPHGPYSCANPSDLPQRVTEWLERSASLPLTIRFDHPTQAVHPGEGALYQGAINILNKHSEKWYDVHFDLPACHLHRLCGSSESQRNILRRLFLRNRRDWDCSTFSMKSKPSPTDLTLVAVGLPYVDIIWSNLTAASVDLISVDECFELMQQAPLLQILSLRGIIYGSSDLLPIPDTRIVLSHLHSLELSTIRDETLVAGILDSVCLPSLEQWIHYKSVFPLDNMISFIGRSSSRPKIFKISIDDLDYHRVTPLLCSLSSLESLELRSYSWSGNFFNGLCASAESPLFLPHLQSLEFSGQLTSPLCKCVLQIFALRPLPHRQSLRVKINARFFHRNDFEDETAKLLLELVDKGFDLSIVDGKVDLLQKYKEERHS
jgi:hypothetical protein